MNQPNYSDAVREFRVVFTPDCGEKPKIIAGKLKILDRGTVVIHSVDDQGSHVNFSCPPESLLYVEALV